MTQPNGKQSMMKTRVRKVVTLEELGQHAGIPGVLTADSHVAAGTGTGAERA